MNSMPNTCNLKPPIINHGNVPCYGLLAPLQARIELREMEEEKHEKLLPTSGAT
uniref:Uncharacterized protein n=1 Tax=Rhizophora mucronata TaxID=61149 RepID=A0A2P2PQE1_RHIMU